MIDTMRTMRGASLAGIVLAASGGCSSVLGLDDFEAGSGGATSATTTSTGDSTTTSTGETTTSTSTGQTSSTSTGGDGGAGSTSSTGGDGGGGAPSQGGGGSSSEGGGGSTSDGGGGATSAGGGGTGGEDVVVGPSVVVASASVANNATTNSSRATFTFASDPPGAAAGYECSLDGAAFENCSSGFDQGLLPGGLRVLQVRARDDVGNLGPILERRWTIEALGTTILALRTGAVVEDTLVQISTNVRATVTIDAPSGQNVFVQDLNGGFTAAQINAVRNHAIRTIARTPGAAPQPGRALVVVGTFQATGGSDRIAAAEYVPGALQTPYEPVQSNDTVEIDVEALESVLIDFRGEVPSFNCSSGCNMQGVCLHGCGQCRPLEYVDFSATGTFDFGFYRGVLVGNGADRAYWFVESSEGGDDVCL